MAGVLAGWNGAHILPVSGPPMKVARPMGLRGSGSDRVAALIGAKSGVLLPPLGLAGAIRFRPPNRALAYRVG
ncbi:MAG: hypothetical protein DI599_12990 [Pseudomonas kuykendallii]|uniref:Uncharacterized protein n=1 Tax=Pseudomonas kuykendallii TaxID=1007099 RepID=A0A2W5D3F6_9PSED|nr:MAG: hypothetical protein DI599_12990 [Pseudomonas kuykendallii]